MSHGARCPAAAAPQQQRHDDQDLRGGQVEQRRPAHQQQPAAPTAQAGARRERHRGVPLLRRPPEKRMTTTCAPSGRGDADQEAVEAERQREGAEVGGADGGRQDDRERSVGELETAWSAVFHTALATGAPAGGALVRGHSA
jgi:hypothetical protein